MVWSGPVSSLSTINSPISLNAMFCSAIALIYRARRRRSSTSFMASRNWLYPRHSTLFSFKSGIPAKRCVSVTNLPSTKASTSYSNPSRICSNVMRPALAKRSISGWFGTSSPSTNRYNGARVRSAVRSNLFTAYRCASYITLLRASTCSLLIPQILL